MGTHIKKYIEGHNITIMCYGQTGSGKTYTMIAPVGSLNTDGGTDPSGKILPHYGLLPRSCLTLYEKMKNSGVKQTISVV